MEQERFEIVNANFRDFQNDKWVDFIVARKDGKEEIKVNYPNGTRQGFIFYDTYPRTSFAEYMETKANIQRSCLQQLIHSIVTCLNHDDGTQSQWGDQTTHDKYYYWWKNLTRDQQAIVQLAYTKLQQKKYGTTGLGNHNIKTLREHDPQPSEASLELIVFKY